MSNARQLAPNTGIMELKASAHLMTLDQGLFCVFQLPQPDAGEGASGLPGVRVTLAPGHDAGDDNVEIRTFQPDGWIGPQDDAALIRIRRGTAPVLVTVYQHMDGAEGPKLQVLRLHDAARSSAAPAQPRGVVRSLPAHATPQVAAPQAQHFPAHQPHRPAAPQAAPQPQTPVRFEVGAHVQMRGDIGARLGEWIGDQGSQRWVEGFAISPATLVGPQDIEYQALLGRGWLSPWAEGGQFCGSRGMALPILGLRVRLRGAAAAAFDCVYCASFVDGSTSGPVRNGEPCESSSLAPLEAFQIIIQQRSAAASTTAAVQADPTAGQTKTGKPAAAKPLAKAPAKSVAKAAAKPDSKPGKKR